MGKRKQLKDGDVEMANTTGALGENDDSSSDEVIFILPRQLNPRSKIALDQLFS